MHQGAAPAVRAHEGMAVTTASAERARLADLRRRQSAEHFRGGRDYDGHNRKAGLSRADKVQRG